MLMTFPWCASAEGILFMYYTLLGWYIKALTLQSPPNTLEASVPLVYGTPKWKWYIMMHIGNGKGIWAFEYFKIWYPPPSIWWGGSSLCRSHLCVTPSVHHTYFHHFISSITLMSPLAQRHKGMVTTMVLHFAVYRDICIYNMLIWGIMALEYATRYNTLYQYAEAQFEYVSLKNVWLCRKYFKRIVLNILARYLDHRIFHWFDKLWWRSVDRAILEAGHDASSVIVLDEMIRHWKLCTFFLFRRYWHHSHVFNNLIDWFGCKLKYVTF